MLRIYIQLKPYGKFIHEYLGKIPLMYLVDRFRFLFKKYLWGEQMYNLMRMAKILPTDGMGNWRHSNMRFHSFNFRNWGFILCGCFIISVMPPLRCVETVIAHADVDPEIAEITQELADHPANVDLLLQRGQLYRFNGKFLESLYDLEKAWLLDPNNSKVALERCRTLLSLERMSDAEAGLNEYLKAESGPSRVMALVERAHLYAKTERGDMAIADFSEAINLYPTVELYLARGHLQEKLGQLDAAAVGYLNGLSQLQQNSMLRGELIRVKTAQRDYQGALVLIEQELEGASVKTEWIMRKAEVLASMGQIEYANEVRTGALEEANRVLAKRATALNRLVRAKVYQSLGQLEEAKSDLRLVLQKSPNLIEAVDLLKNLESP